MTLRVDVAIAGAGLLGLASAWYLRAAGAEVAVFDAGTAGGEASWAGGGSLWPIYPWRYPAPVQRLAADGAARYPALCRELMALTGIDPQWRRTGVVILDEDEITSAQDWARAVDTPCAILEARDIAARLPGARATRGVWLPEQAQLRNPRLCRALVAGLRVRGVTVYEHRPVQAVRRCHGRFLGFDTAAGPVAANAGVIAAGAWTSQLLPADCGLPGITPVKGQMLLFKTAPERLPHIVVRDGRYLIPRADGRILVGSTVERVGFDRQPRSTARRDLLAAASAMLPWLAEFAPTDHWAGLRPATDDGLPVCAAVPGLDGLYVNSGHFRNGVACAPAAAAALTGLIRAC